jgi:hypothetical protein
MIEDHEILVDVMSHWTRDSENKIFFTERINKYEMFLRPELYLMNGMAAKLDEATRTKLLHVGNLTNILAFDRFTAFKY